MQFDQTKDMALLENHEQLLLRQKEELDVMIRQSDKRIKRYENLPFENVRVSTSNGCTQYYFYNQANKKLRFAKKEELELVTQIVQREYEISVNRRLKRLKKKLEQFVSSYNVDEIKDIYDNACQAKQSLIQPIMLSDKKYIEHWRELHPGNRNSFPAETTYETDAGEFVRSKSEKILADLFCKFHVPYQYETEIVMENGQRFYPDFALLNLKKRKTIYWEHFGLISEEEYACKSLGKLSLYEKNGLIIGEDLLISMESEKTPLDIKLIEKKIKSFLL